jgi:hypothetical protein
MRSRTVTTKMYSAGVTNRFSCVETTIPPNTAVPRECRAALPAPVANTSGTTARMNASDVMMFSMTTIASSTTSPVASVKPKKRDRVDREAEHLHEGECADERDRDLDRRNQRRPPSCRNM